MGRIRTIRPEFFKHERLADLSPLHRLLFIGLWCQADREGRMEYRPRRLKIEILPFDDCDLDAMVADLERHPDRLVVRYAVEGRHFLQIPSFARHQRFHPKENPSQIPEIPKDFMHDPCMSHACPMHDHASRYPEYPEYPVTPDSGVTATATSGQQQQQPEVNAGRDTFDVFWEQYPRKTDKREAFGIWAKLRLELVPDVMAGLMRWRASPEWEDGFAPSPARFLRRRKWEDEPPSERARSGPNRTASEKTMDNARDFLRKHGAVA